jgi:hypothetical protein
MKAKDAESGVEEWAGEILRPVCHVRLISALQEHLEKTYESD